MEKPIKGSVSFPEIGAELPTSTFLPYFVRFLKENTAVRVFLQKYVVFFLDFFFPLNFF